MVVRRISQGFTLIELLIVIVIIGILATIAIPRFGGAKDSAQLALMDADLRNLATAQEARFALTGSYASSLEELTTLFQPSENVTLSLESDGTEYTASVALMGDSRQRCSMRVKDRGRPEFVPPNRSGRGCGRGRGS
ncbi:MAG: type IV pilin protein, partial [Gemmatimonadaceae bacterium]